MKPTNFRADSPFNITEFLLKEKAKNLPNKIALILVERVGVERRITYQALYQAVCRLTAGLNQCGFNKGSPIAIQARDVYDFILLLFATMAAGLVPVPLINSLTSLEVTEILQKVNAAAFFNLNFLSIAPKNLNCLLIDEEKYNQIKNFPEESIHSSTFFKDPAFIFYTSGSTGIPKGVIHAHHSIIGRLPSLKYWLEINAEDIVLQTDNLCWTYSLFTGLLDPLMMGATAVIICSVNQSSLAEDKIAGKMWIDIINFYQVSIVASTYDIYNRILSEGPFQKPPSLKMVGSAGAPLPLSVQEKWQALFQMPIYTALGMSEISTFISTGQSTPPRKNSLGKIQPGRKVDILSLDEVEGMGMLGIHKDELGLMLGYVDDIDKKDYMGDWFLTKDLVSKDEEGYIYYHGRIDTLIKVSGGFRVSPIEVENTLKLFPMIKDAACGSERDEKTQLDILVAYIVVEHPKQAIFPEIYAHLKSRLSDYKIPQIIYCVEKLPINQRGKLMRNQLKNLACILKGSSVDI